MTRVLNPRTGRYITVGKKVYNDLVSSGYTHDAQTNTMIHSLLNEDIPDINVIPLKPTKYQEIKNKIVTFVKRNTNKLADWILNLKPENIKRILPTKIVELIELSNSYWKRIPIYWQINIPRI